MSSHDLYFLVEGGAALALAEAHVARRIATEKANKAICVELGVSRYLASFDIGVVSGVASDGKRHPDFKAANRRGVSSPRKGTEWQKRFDEQVGYDRLGREIVEMFGIPTGLSYTGPSGEYGGGFIGDPFRIQSAGFLYLTSQGPFAIWCPNVPAAVAVQEAKGFAVEEPAKSWRPEIDGARPILKQEWDLIVAEHELARARKAAGAEVLS